MSLYILLTTKNIQRVLICGAILFVCFAGQVHAATESKQLALYAQSSYSPYSQTTYYSQSAYSSYSQSSYSPYSYSQSSYYNQSSYYGGGSGGTYTQSTYYNQGSYSPYGYIPTCTLTATPSAIVKGSTSVLAWDTTNATKVVLTRMNGTSTQPVDGSVTVKPGRTFEYSIKASNTSGYTTCKKTVTVKPPYAQTAYSTGSVLGVSTDVYAQLLQTLSELSAALKSLK
jgi:hypothetical protein